MKIALLCSVITLVVVGGMKTGGLTEEHKGSTEEVNKLVKGLEKEIREMAVEKGVTGLGKLEVVSYKTQLVAGVNYFVKIKTGSGEYIHARIYTVPWGKPEKSLTSIQTGKLLTDPIEYFEKPS